MSRLKIMNLPARFDFHFHKQFSQVSDEFFCDTTFSSLELDFTTVNYVDSSAIGMMILLYKKAKAKNIKISIRGARGLPVKILEQANLSKLYDLN